MRKTIAMLRSRKIRESLRYNLARVWVEHRYDQELTELSRLVGVEKHSEAKALIEKLRQSNGYYLEPSLIRAETFLDFMED